MRRAFAILFLSVMPVQAPDVEAEKGWMNDATDLQEDIREAMGKKDTATVAEAALKIEALMARTEAFWSARKAADIVKLAQTARMQARNVAAQAKAGRLDEAAGVFSALNTTCNTCHDLHPEKR
jgi:hypothetical protein